MEEKELLRRLADAACAVYRVGEKLPAEDPLVRILKESALSATASCVVFFYAPKIYNRIKAHSDIETLRSFFVVAREQKWIDACNFNVLLSEYQAIKEELTSVIGYPGDPISNGEQASQDINKDRPAQLSQRQQRIFVYMQNKGGEKVSLKDLRELFPDVASRTVQRDVQDLLEMGIINKKGITHNTTYYLDV